MNEIVLYLEVTSLKQSHTSISLDKLILNL